MWHKVRAFEGVPMPRCGWHAHLDLHLPSPAGLVPPPVVALQAAPKIAVLCAAARLAGGALGGRRRVLVLGARLYRVQALVRGAGRMCCRTPAT